MSAKVPESYGKRNFLGAAPASSVNYFCYKYHLTSTLSKKKSLKGNKVWLSFGIETSEEYIAKSRNLLTIPLKSQNSNIGIEHSEEFTAKSHNLLTLFRIFKHLN